LCRVFVPEGQKELDFELLADFHQTVSPMVRSDVNAGLKLSNYGGIKLSTYR
ncbi:MAG: hypothetical protein XD72_2417, partial [Methanothrix harundinacea]